MLIRDDQFDTEDFPVAYHLKIQFMSGNSLSAKSSLENCPDKHQRNLIAEMISETVKMLEGDLLGLKVRKKKIEMIIDASINIEKIFNIATLGIIEILRKSNQFSEQINLWEPEKNIKNLSNPIELEKAIRSLKGEKVIALEKGA